MRYQSLSNPDLSASFSTALLSSLAPDGGLYFPDSFPRLDVEERARLAALPFQACAAGLARYFVDENFPEDTQAAICASAYNFPLPLRTLAGWELDPAMNETANDFILELFHGPTLAFKDFAARFMGRAVSHLLTKSGETRTVLVATSGDTGGAVGYAFLGLPGVKVYILYPKNGVSRVQEAQLTGMGKNSNVKAIAVEGTFDECQALVKQAFADTHIRERYHLMSANSINVGRVIPQSFYYFWTALRLKAAYPNRPLAFSIPSGNLGNLTGALIARKMGAPIDRLVVGNNNNHPFIDFLDSGEFEPRPSIATLSNAMDIGNPNNFPRVRALFAGNDTELRRVCTGSTYTDLDTERHIRRVHAMTGYLMCPHTAIGHMAMQKFKDFGGQNFTRVCVSTAHPAKFKDEVERIIHEDIPLPAALQKCVAAPSFSHDMAADIGALADYLRKTQS